MVRRLEWKKSKASQGDTRHFKVLKLHHYKTTLIYCYSEVETIEILTHAMCRKTPKHPSIIEMNSFSSAHISADCFQSTRCLSAVFRAIRYTSLMESSRILIQNT